MPAGRPLHERDRLAPGFAGARVQNVTMTPGAPGGATSDVPGGTAAATAVPARALRVLLFAERQGDAASGDSSYAEALLADPPPGVSYTTYDEALRDGTLRVRGEKPWRRPIPGDLAIYGIRSVESLLRRGVIFREPYWFVSIDGSSFDLVHQHLFAVRQIGSSVPVVSGAGYPLPELYRARERWSEPHLRLALAIESAASRLLDVHVPWLRPTSGAVMTVYTEHFRQWLLERGADPDRVQVVSTALGDLGLTPKASDGRTLAFIARDFQLKGGDVALAALRRLRESDPSWRLLVVTSSAAAERYVKPEPGIELVIDPPREAVLRDLLPQIDILLAPTRSDGGVPYAVLEALQAGICVVTSEVPWLDLRLQSPAVTRVPATADAVAAAVGQLVGQDLRGAQVAARELWRRELSMEQLHPLLLNAYGAALRAHRA